MKLALSLAILSLVTCSTCLDPLSATVAVGAAAISKAGQLFCATGLRECCDSKWVKNDVDGLKKDLQKRLHGQHLVTQILTKAITAHVLDDNPQKPLVMSFHGWTGGGKSFVAQMIMENLYELGDKSRFVHLFYSELHFKHDSQIGTYKDQLHQWIFSNASACQRSLFIFDEMDNMPPGMIDVLIPFLGHYKQVDGVDFRKSIFLFIGNTGGDLISKIAYKQTQEEKRREDLALHDFQEPLEISTFNVVGGLQGSGIIQRQLIDHLIPFLPLERRHVKMCVKDEFRRLGRSNFTDAFAEQVLNELEWGPGNDGRYSKSGCTKVAQKIKLYPN